MSKIEPKFYVMRERGGKLEALGPMMEPHASAKSASDAADVLASRFPHLSFAVLALMAIHSIHHRTAAKRVETPAPAKKKSADLHLIDEAKRARRAENQ